MIVHIEATEYMNFFRGDVELSWRMFGVNEGQVAYIYPFEKNQHWTVVVFQDAPWLILKMSMNQAIAKLSGVKWSGDWGPG
jgi:hypothetical protein